MRRSARNSGVMWLLLLFVLTTPDVQGVEDEPPIVTHMKRMNDSLRKLRGQYDRSDLQAENLQLVEAIRVNAKAARELEPLKTPRIPLGEREAFLKAFRTELDEVLDTLGQLETAVIQSDFESARELIVELYDLKEQGHKRFQNQ